MLHLCSSCGKIINQGDRVTFLGTAVYLRLKSSIAYALDKSTLEIDSDTLMHKNCRLNDDGKPDVN